jgi:hypothetical protein
MNSIASIVKKRQLAACWQNGEKKEGKPSF